MSDKTKSTKNPIMILMNFFKNIIKRIQEYRENHPRYRYWLNRFGEFVGYLNFPVLVVYVIFVAIFLFRVYYLLPENLRTLFITVLTVILTSLFIPFYFQQRKKLRDLYKRNETYYLGIASAILDSRVNGEINAKMCYQNVGKYARENADVIYAQFSYSVIHIIREILLESEKDNSAKLLDKHILKYFKVVRQHLGLSRVFQFNKYF